MKISEENKEEIRQLRKELEALSPVDPESYSELELDSFLQFQKSVPAAAKALLASRKWVEDNPVTIADVASYYRSPQGQSSPPACLVCLEDGKGGVARDHEGRPIINMMGVVYGSEEELKQQIVYALQRAALYRLPHHRPGEVCFVAEATSRGTNKLNPTFRIPDANVRALFDFMKNYYPGSQFSTVHFCGLPSFVVGFFKVVKPFMSAEIFSRLKLKANFTHLKNDGYVEPDSLLPVWDKQGTFRFDLDEYVEWRAREEGIPLSQICPKGEGRTYDGTPGGMNHVVSLQEILGTEEGKAKVIKSGWGEKQGSGMGLFSSSRWKSKYLVLTPGLLVYFESSKVSPSNQASRLITIDESCTVGRLCTDEKKAMVCLQSADREYVFGFSSEKEAEEWIHAFQKQIDAKGTPTSSVKPSSAISLGVGHYHISQLDRRLSTTDRKSVV